MIFITIGPRQIAGWSRLDHHAERDELHAVRLERHDLLVHHRRRADTPIIRGMLGP